jgi:mono/diheme cytochrome c family protein
MKTRNGTLKWTTIAAAAVLALTLPVAGDDDEPTRGQLMEEGSSSYNLYCQSCHGQRGKGDGSVAGLLNIAPADLTQISARRDGVFPEEEIYQIIDGRKDVRAHGSDMPLWGDAFQRTEETADEAVIRRKIDGLVAYLQALQERAPAEQPADE